MYDMEKNFLFTDVDLYNCVVRLARGGIAHNFRCWMHDYFKGGAHYE